MLRRIGGRGVEGKDEVFGVWLGRVLVLEEAGEEGGFVISGM